MAGSKEDDKQKPPHSFADDLDSMLNLDETAEQAVGLIDDDDDAIDRLLVGNAFEVTEDGGQAAEMDDFDQLIVGEKEQDNALLADYDEFGDDVDDLISNIQLNPKQDRNIADADMAQLDDVIPEHADVAPLERVDEIDAVTEDDFTVPELAIDSTVGSDDVLENMAEIDEFSDPPLATVNDNNNFLLADFDISADDDLIPDEFDTPVQPLPASELAEPEPHFVADAEQIAIDSQSELAASITEDPADDLLVESVSEQLSSRAQPEPRNVPPDVDSAAIIAGLTNQIHDLTKKHAHLANELRLKGDKEELGTYAEAIESLQSEQKKTKRTMDALANKKPISAYVANGIAVFALFLGGGLGYQGFVAKNQVDQVVEYLNKIQAQISEAPAANAADNELLRNQLEELSRASNVNSDQIAVLTKAMQGGGGSAASDKPAGDIAKQLAELSNQDMQMGAVIESLQNKVTALEKAKPVAPVAKAEKAEPKKQVPAPVQDNWVVNLVAFKQDWYAKRKAEEYASKGVPAQVIKSDSKGETWYRLSVDGFKSQYEAAAYAARVKKSLNLDSVWVNKDKN